MHVKTLDVLFEVFSSSPGWLSHLIETQHLESDAIAYLEMRDREECKVQALIDQWESDMEREGGIDIYCEEDLGRKLMMINGKIAELEAVGRDASYLSVSRHQTRSRIIAREVPDRVQAVTDEEIAYARTVRLDKVIPDLPKNRKILCPLHQDSNPSFHVTKWGYCFSCGGHLDSISWLIRQEGYSFIRAIKRLGEIH